ncbi:hypothetical protein [Amycolatopsis sp. H20-H5]|uniref:hypothetical protein n=1 Tax=Amycolatopsis sp. H20-H5 TaxID=3046309 RepID=UPI002DB8A86B|nr:hypothetical protein [Amycolatopsis sp. H20-H5]MEC3973737.1 hypothetical protein [Amycolatopsis sp. H20-H5]
MDTVTVKAWADFTEDCPIKYSVRPDEIELSIGGGLGLDLFTNEAGAVALIEACTEALADLRARSDE